MNIVETMNIRDKATDAIKRIEKTNRVIISELQTAISATDGMGDVHVTAFIGTEVCRPHHYTLRWDSKRNEFVEQPSIASQFKQEYNDFRLSHMTKQEIFALLVKANRRRKSAERKWRMAMNDLRFLLEDETYSPVTLVPVITDIEDIHCRKPTAEDIERICRKYAEASVEDIINE